MKKNPIEISSYIMEEFSEYISSTYVLDDDEYQKKLEEQLRSTDLFNGPFLHTELPFTTGNTIRELVLDRKISPEFLKLEKIYPDRSLYLHQQKSLEKIKSGRNVVITTGTGSGKTESFLYPIIDSIMDEITKGKKKTGVRAIFLYPMNALVNDQKDRIRKLLKDYPQITFGSYTGDTKPKFTAAERKNYIIEEGIDEVENELLTREEIRNNPPDLLFTNYSMLEYLLIRPSDSRIINPENMSYWRYMVLDEAHTYKGTLGVEIALLLRRLVAMAKKNPQFILTSATLGGQENVKDIVSFARSLTSSDYASDDIIFASRKQLNQSNIAYSAPNHLYEKMIESIEDIDALRKIAAEYFSITSNSSMESLLYEILIHDKNVYELYDAIDTTNQFTEVLKKMRGKTEIIQNQLLALIQLVSLANKDNSYIYDAKFHMFLRTPSKAYITLKDDKQIRIHNSNTINNKKAFEIGICKNCNHIYLIGRIENGILEQNDNIDIYENYGEDYSEHLDYFIIKEDIEYEELEEYSICSKCGNIYNIENENFANCGCGEKHRLNLYRIDNSKSKLKNNLTQCICCGGKNNMGIIHSFTLNKDNATSIIAQLFYQAMEDEDNRSDEIIGCEDIDIFSLDSNELSVKADHVKVKQLLAFSDSRQQASFFSVSFKYNHERFLRRRIIWEEVKDLDSIKVRTLATNLARLIKQNNLFEQSETKAQSEAWISILNDLIYVDGKYGSEGLGIYSYVFDYTNYRDLIKKFQSNIESIFELSLDNFYILLNIIFDRLRRSSIIDYSIAELSDQERKDAFQYVDQERYIVLKKDPKTKIKPGKYIDRFIDSFLPVKETSNNQTIDYLMKLYDIPFSEAVVKAEKLFAFLVNMKILKEGRVADNLCYQLNILDFKCIPNSKMKWYVCTKCKRITVNNINDICPSRDCDGKLELCSPDDLFSKNYYRKHYMEKKIESIITKEHTAQLDKKSAKQYQNDFRDKKINILSCSTTFEMGVDLGDLENVFLRNVPPTPANYVQRAGRAGRSKESSALVVTYCGANSHDFAYFNNPYKLINGMVNPPKFSISNKKIVIRHILAAALGMFFRSEPQYFSKLRLFVFEDGFSKFKDYIRSKPEDLRLFVDNGILKESIFTGYRNFGWVEEVLDFENNLEIFINELTNQLSTYQEARDQAVNDKEFGMAKYYNNQINDINNRNTVENLSRYAVIPKYGFPIDVVELRIVTDMNSDKKYDMNKYNLQRDLSIAISEYAPGSEVVVDGNKYLSRYINVPRKGDLERYYYYECDNCKTTEISLTPFEDATCSSCHHKLIGRSQYFVIPKLGFTTDKNAKRSRTVRPLKTYAGEIKYLGGGKKDEDEFEYGSLVTIESISDDQLLVLNKSGFFYCPKCGYTKIDKQNSRDKIEERANHTNAYGSQCDNRSLEKIALGHIFKTDVIKLIIDTDMLYYEALTLTYALLEGLSQSLQIERTDINGIISFNGDKRFEIVLFDNVPGGAGHVKRLTNALDFRKVVCAAYDVVNKNCCDEDTTCYSCLRNYYNQKYHAKMKRKYAKDILKMLIDDQLL